MHNVTAWSLGSEEDIDELQRFVCKCARMTSEGVKTRNPITASAEAAAGVLQFLEDTEVGKKIPGEGAQDDSWDIERLDRG